MAKINADPSILNQSFTEAMKEGLKETPTQEIVPSDATLEPKSEVKQEEVTPAPAESGVSGDEKPRVPYSRFEQQRQEALEAQRAAEEAQREADYWRSQAETRHDRSNERMPQFDASSPYEGDLPSWWKNLYGESKESRVAYSAELQRQQFIEERAEQRAFEALDRRQQADQQAFQNNLTTVDSRIEDIETMLGRNLTAQEEDRILDILEENSPKDRDGNIEALMSADSALRFFQLEQQQQQAPKNAARNNVAALSGRSAGGDVSTKETDPNWRPWGWRNRFK